jgi:chloramphenicol-sensitive protein RarD
VSERQKGLAYGVAAYLMWGLFPLYWRLVDAASALEILAHRIVWSLAFVALLLAVRRRLGVLRAVLANRRRLGLLGGAGMLLALNWGTYIYGVNSGRVVETSLGYFINPLVTVLLGVTVLRERLRLAQWCAIGIGTLAVAVLAIDYGRLPFIALVLAISFAFYGLAKKQADVGPIDSLAIETGLLALPAAGTLTWFGTRGQATFASEGPLHATLLGLGGAVTAIPLLAFGAAAIRAPLSTLGLLQYLAPALQFSIGVLVFREPMPPERILGFALVWLALGLLSVDGLRARWRAMETVADPTAALPGK